jgi:hypothetical protein
VDLKSRPLQPAAPSSLGLVGRGRIPSLLRAKPRRLPSTSSRKNNKATAFIPLPAPMQQSSGRGRRTPPTISWALPTRIPDGSGDTPPREQQIGGNKILPRPRRCCLDVAAREAPPHARISDPGRGHLICRRRNTDGTHTPISHLYTCRRRRSWSPLPSRRRSG